MPKLAGFSAQCTIIKNNTFDNLFIVALIKLKLFMNAIMK